MNAACPEPTRRGCIPASRAPCALLGAPLLQLVGKVVSRQKQRLGDIAVSAA